MATSTDTLNFIGSIITQPERARVDVLKLQALAYLATLRFYSEYNELLITDEDFVVKSYGYQLPNASAQYTKYDAFDLSKKYFRTYPEDESDGRNLIDNYGLLFDEKRTIMETINVHGSLTHIALEKYFLTKDTFFKERERGGCVCSQSLKNEVKCGEF